MTPADRRIKELIDKWLASIDLHLKYVDLSDADYARAQSWPKHDRPTRWVLEVARQKTLELQAHTEARRGMGDGKFSESLELMMFLANLVGIQNIQRFIPLAGQRTHEDETSGTGEPAASASGSSQTIEAPTIINAPFRPAPSPTDDSTREMPHLKSASASKAPSPGGGTAGISTQRSDNERSEPAAPGSHSATTSFSKTSPVKTLSVKTSPVQTSRIKTSKDSEPAVSSHAPAPASRNSSVDGAARQSTAPADGSMSDQGPDQRPSQGPDQGGHSSSSHKATAPKTSPTTAVTPDLKSKIIADAVRLSKWGKPWHELADLIARIADRPPVGEIRKILRASKSDIQAKAAQR